jgi:nucleoside-diphosphate-sugar epimerase
MRKVLFLGGSGFLGQHLLRSLAGDFRIFAVARSQAAARKIQEASSSVRIVSADEAAETRFDRILNLVVDYGRGGTSLTELMQPNLLYPLALLEQIEAEVVINVSTALPCSYSNYALSKKLLEQSLNYLEQRTGRRFLNIHLHNMYGPGAEITEIVGYAVSRMLAGKSVEVSDCRNSRDFIFVADVVEALAAISAHPESLARGVPVEVGSGRSTSLRELISRIQSLAGSAADIRFGAKPCNPFEPPVLKAKIAPLRALGWTPRYSLDEGLRATMDALAARRRQFAEQA